MSRIFDTLIERLNDHGQMHAEGISIGEAPAKLYVGLPVSRLSEDNVAKVEAAAKRFEADVRAALGDE